jgi:hypothetical protein
MSDIVEDLCSAGPEETPSAAKIIMTRAAAEIETLRTRLVGVEELMADRHDEIERLCSICDIGEYVAAFSRSMNCNGQLAR